MVDMTVTIQGPDGTQRYSVRAPVAAARAGQALARAVEVGFALLGAHYRKEPDEQQRMETRRFH